ncbi:MAG: type II toxin-antitoxin system RelE/ParE family toxin [Oscillospiraceae bacterium]|jgi:phage-related protein|nr:type II toxin-antitoxin system RelE/ParE family toxin [Oscillospiraceae bacterium]
MGWNVRLYAKENGEEPVSVFIASLPSKHQAKALWEIDLLEEHGAALREPYVKAVSGERYKGMMELRIQHGSDISRIFYFFPVRDTFILLHGFVKKDMKTPRRELETALRYMDDYRRRYL